MSMNICGAPCCWGVDDVKNPYLPPWKTVLKEAGEAGYRAIELGPYGYLPINIEEVSAELEKNGLSIVAGTIFDDLVDEANYENLLKQTDDICSLITKLPPLLVHEGQHYPAPYMTIMDWGQRLCRRTFRPGPKAYRRTVVSHDRPHQRNLQKSGRIRRASGHPPSCRRLY